jgi:electron transport complex protein RnfD
MENMSLYVSASPHVHDPLDTRTIMRDVIIALAPATLAAIVLFGVNALLLFAVSVLAAVGTEWGLEKLMHKKSTLGDLSAVVTGLLVAMNVPASAPWWLVLVGSCFAIGLVKMAFGGLGSNFMNPALTARAVLLAAWPARMSGAAYIAPVTLAADAVTSATPLALLKEGAVDQMPSVWNLLIGNIGGCMGEVCALALLLGAAYLFIRRIITWRIPLTYLATVAVLVFLLKGFQPMTVLYHLLSGGLILGAFFMATDYTTSPTTPWGQILMGLGCGVLTVIIRLYGGYPEGVSYSILLMNVATPLLDRWTRPRSLGEVRKHA